MAKSVIVTGAGQGLGRALAIYFAHEGYRVMACDSNPESVASVVAAIQAGGGEAAWREADISVASHGEAVVDEACRLFGGVDVLINNAAVRAHVRRPFWEIPDEEFARFLAVNVQGTWSMMRAVVPHMQEQRAGSIINISSAAVLEVPPHQLQYVTSKAGVIGLTRAAARELGEWNVRVNAILPTSLETEIPKRTIDESGARRRLLVKSLRRAQTPDDLVGVALFLASDASRYMTGQSLNVDGGTDFF
jgi:3-oxoacyl-[acyl-carrier protein] reductase